MKRVLEDELISLAERILKLKNRADIHQLKKETAILYEKLSILAFAESHFGGLKSEVSKTEFKDAFSEQFSDIDEESGHYKSPDGMDYNPNPISEPNTEKIKDIVSQMPPESEQVDLLLEQFAKLAHHSRTNPDTKDEESSSDSELNKEEPGTQNSPAEDDFNSYGVHFDDLPNFEPRSEEKQESKPEEPQESNSGVSSSPQEQDAQPPKREDSRSNLNSAHQEKRSLNDKLKKGIKIGLNDRIAFTNQLFGGSTDDYNRVLSQLNTMSSYEEALRFIQLQVKPDYGHWEGKEAVEERFMQIVERKFDA
ncbi:hypothetical protein [Psychroflexus tropicus]|uniref:hypothetical protein n=1 Tax=Psychroflexus tropicus TaxID=197345 RepID=UPI0003824B3D|nr:hypothetical protein [Psychroflexus tropicus]